MHPDMIFIGPEENKKNITIAQIREVGHRIAARPNEAAHRMVCIQDAERMNHQAQNSLLKVLEEPPEHTFFILIANDITPLLPTILSRCRKFRFAPQSPERIKETLCAGNIEPALARVIALTQGPDLPRALDCAANGGPWKVQWPQFRQWLIQAVIGIILSPPQAVIAQRLDLSRKLALDPQRMASARAIIRTVLRDLCVFAYRPDKIVNLDFFDSFKDISQKYVYSTFLEWLTAFTQIEQRLDANSSPRLALDKFFLGLSVS